MLSTGNGRAEVEFENGAMAFLGANSVLEFFDLSLNDGSRITRLILRQGSASFFDRSENGDYFSVTGGDFSSKSPGAPPSAWRISTMAAPSPFKQAA